MKQISAFVFCMLFIFGSVYAHGGHAFGLRPTKFPITRWPQLVDMWLHTIGML